TRVLGDAGVEQHLQQQVAQFLLDGLGVAGLDGVEQFAGLLEQVGPQRVVGLGAFPAAEVPQPVHHLHGSGQARGHHGGVGRLLVHRADASVGTERSTTPWALPSSASSRSATNCSTATSRTRSAPTLSVTRGSGTCTRPLAAREVALGEIRLSRSCLESGRFSGASLSVVPVTTISATW